MYFQLLKTRTNNVFVQMIHIFLDFNTFADVDLLISFELQYLALTISVILTNWLTDRPTD